MKIDEKIEKYLNEVVLQKSKDGYFEITSSGNFKTKLNNGSIIQLVQKSNKSVPYQDPYEVYIDGKQEGGWMRYEDIIKKYKSQFKGRL